MSRCLDISGALGEVKTAGGCVPTSSSFPHVPWQTLLRVNHGVPMALYSNSVISAAEGRPQCVSVLPLVIMDLDKVYVSAVAFCAVFFMLAVLAGLMSLLTRVFPGKAPEKRPRKASLGGASDEQLVAAVAAAVSIAVPGGHVTKIEELK